MTNVVLVTIDCLRADHVSYYGYARETTPFLDRLATDGLVFSRAFANGPNTRHSVSSFLTSTYPLLFLQEAQRGRLHAGRMPLAEMLQRRGFTTAAVHSNPFISQFYGYHRGFDYFNDFVCGQVDEERDRHAVSKALHEVIKGLKAVVAGRLPHAAATAVNRQALEWLQTVEEPFFLWLHYMDVHMPYVPPARVLRELGLPRYGRFRKIWMGKKIDDPAMRARIPDGEVPDYVNLYDGCIRYVDRALQEIIPVIERQFPDTLFVVTADHGEEFREHGDLGHHPKLYDELLHVPLLFYGPGIASRSLDTLVSLIDVVPTLLGMLDVPPPDGMQGQVMPPPDGYVIAEAWEEGRVTAYRDAEWKLIVGEGERQHRELYHLPDDPGEHENVYRHHSQTAGELEKMVHRHVDTQRRSRRRRNTVLQKEKIRRATRGIRI